MGNTSSASSQVDSETTAGQSPESRRDRDLTGSSPKNMLRSDNWAVYAVAGVCALSADLDGLPLADAGMHGRRQRLHFEIPGCSC